LKNYTIAEEKFSEANCINNSSSETWVYLGMIAMYQGAIEKARFCLKNSFKQDNHPDK
ncbi:MAG: Cilia- and flagella-associated protein 70, partial [Paramarteilia canceri]